MLTTLAASHHNTQYATQPPSHPASQNGAASHCYSTSTTQSTSTCPTLGSLRSSIRPSPTSRAALPGTARADRRQRRGNREVHEHPGTAPTTRPLSSLGGLLRWQLKERPRPALCPPQVNLRSTLSVAVHLALARLSASTRCARLSIRAGRAMRLSLDMYMQQGLG